MRKNIDLQHLPKRRRDMPGRASAAWNSPVVSCGEALLLAAKRLVDGSPCGHVMNVILTEANSMPFFALDVTYYSYRKALEVGMELEACWTDHTSSQ